MSPLVTRHDPFHVHKTLGLLVLLHFIYRYALLFSCGTAFPATESLSAQTAGVLLHGVLTWSSLLLRLPAKRNFASPMIWPEFRLHSIAFTTRHVIATLLTLHGIWPGDKWAAAFAKVVLALGTVQAASSITARYGSREQRLTNSLPYPKSVGDEQQRSIKYDYAVSQFCATAIALLPDPTLNWAPILGLQAAPFMMTLVRKNKISSFTYHGVYSWSLWMGQIVWCVRWWQTDWAAAMQAQYVASVLAGSVLFAARYYWRWPTIAGWPVQQYLQWAGYVLAVIVFPEAVASLLPFAPARLLWWSALGVVTKAWAYRHLFSPSTACMYCVAAMGALYSARDPSGVTG